MANREVSRISYDSHIFLDQSLLRLPYELLRKNFRSAHFTFEKESFAVKSLLKDTAKGSLDGTTSPENVVKNLDSILVKMRGMKHKLSAYAEEESRLYTQIDARVAHVCELSEMDTVEDVKYETWSRKRLDRLLVDYLLRHGYNMSATVLAEERGMIDLVDINTFVAMSKIRTSLQNGSVGLALSWCQDNKKELRRMQSNLEFMLRCQQYVEMMRTGSTFQMMGAISHAKKYIVPYNETYPIEVRHMAGLLAYRADTTLEPYVSWYAPSRWSKLADIFMAAHNKLLDLPSVPLLHIALSMGLSALKTPACHGRVATTGSSGGDHSTPSQNAVHRGTGKQGSTVMSLTTNVCPICSTELNELARNVPYAHHTKSHVANDLLVLPNDRVYGQARLGEYAAKASLPPGLVKDLVTGELYKWEKLKKVFIT